MRHVLRTAAALVALAPFGLLAASPASAWDRNRPRTIEIANLNILHGFACDPATPGDGDQCRVSDRIDLLIRHIEAIGCPDLVTLQENVTGEFVQRTATEFVGPLDDTVALIRERLPRLRRHCGVPYRVVFDPAAERPPAQGRGTDEELILSRYPIVSSETLRLYSPLDPFFFRHVLYARVLHPVEPLDVFTTHLASGSDLASLPCGINVLPGPPFTPLSPACPAECVPFVDSVRECQAKQLALFVESRHTSAGPAFVTGDFNAEPGSAEYAEFTSRGWIDSHLAAGNPECAPLTGLNCTSGRNDDDLSDLESTALGQVERIDFIFEVPPTDDARCEDHGFQNPQSHPHFPVTGTGLFAAEPNPFAPACGAAPLPICWPSDHSGNMANLDCRVRRAHFPWHW
jgi:endonuclease/exonuclease/phosphatase family metal-dependent hydrolase